MANNNEHRRNEDTERAWWAHAGLPKPEMTVTFDRERWAHISAIKTKAVRSRPSLWAVGAAALAVALVGGTALWQGILQQYPAAAALYAKELPQRPLRFEVVVTSQRILETTEVSLTSGIRTDVVHHPLNSETTYSVFDLASPSIQHPDTGWQMGDLQFAITARDPNALSADFVAVVPTGGRVTVRSITTNTLLKSSGHRRDLAVWPITMGTGLRVTLDQPGHSAQSYLLKIAWMPLPAKIGAPAVVGVLPHGSGGQPNGNARAVSLPPQGTIVAALPQGLLVRTPKALGLDSWNGVFTPLLRASAGWSVVVGTGPWVLISHYSLAMPRWPGSHVIWWNMTTGQLRAADLGQPDWILASGDEFVVSGGTHSGVYKDGRQIAVLPPGMSALAAAGMQVAGWLDGQLGTYNALDHHFQPAGLTAIEGHPVSPSFPGIMLWLPQWGPTLVVWPGGHQPWPNAHAHLAAISGRFAPTMMEPDLLGRGSNSFLIRMVGNLVEAGWPNAQGQWAWHHVATTRSRNLLIIPNGVYWQDASGTHVWFGPPSSDSQGQR